MLTELHPLTRADLVVGATYRAKRPRAVPGALAPQLNDRTITWIGERQVQYNGPEVRADKKLPIMSTDRFLTWVGYRMPASQAVEDLAKLPRATPDSERGIETGCWFTADEPQNIEDLL